MNFNVTQNKNRASLGGHLSSSHGPSTGSCQLTMYHWPPIEEVALEEFENFALDRLRVLKNIEDAKTRGKKHEEMDSLVDELWRRHMREGERAESVRKDKISHFALRLAYCQTEELRRWFLAQESSLFRHRFRNLTPDWQKKFLEENNLPYKAIGSAELEAVKEKLDQVARSINGTAGSVYYKVPFEQVPELVGGRRVFLKGGKAYVPRDQLTSIVGGLFREGLSKALTLTGRKWAASIAEEERDRLTSLVESLSSRYLGPDYSQVSSKQELADLPVLAERSFPMCMRHMYRKLKEDHHLKHNGRLQLGLFLKGIGLSLEDTLTFWRSEFSQKMGSEKFDKEYSYMFRHGYGKEGKRMDYTPYGCMKIIMSTPGVGDHHGCPYRHFSEENLRTALSSLRLSSQSVDEAVEKAKNNHYQLACGVAFEGLRGSECESGITHPNHYFQQSEKLIQAKNEDGKKSSQENLSPDDRSEMDMSKRV